MKYIFKSSFYIYQIPFLLNTRKNIINILKRNFKELRNPKGKDNNNIKERMKYIIEKLVDSDFYYKKYFDNLNYNHLKEILYYYIFIFYLFSYWILISLLNKIQIFIIFTRSNYFE